MDKRMVFIGGGNMATCLLKGIVSSGYDKACLWVIDPNEHKRNHLADTLGIHTDHEAVEQIAAQAEVIVLAVKPHVVATALKPLVKVLAQCKALIISVAAGISLQSIAAFVGNNHPIVRAMPNTAVQVGYGATGLHANAHVNEQTRLWVTHLFTPVGKVQWLQTEAEIDAVIALSGSGPAYFLLMMEAMQAAGVALGLSETIAEELCVQTALGAAHLAASGELSAAKLRAQITSPGGTTQAAIKVLQQGGLEDLLLRAMQQAFMRAQALEEQKP